MYKNGKLTKATRDKLTKIYQKERSKDSILSKFDRKYGQKEKSAATPRAEGTKVDAAKPVAEKKTVPAVAAPQVQDDVASQSESMPDTPKRTRVLEQRKAAEALSGDLNWVSMIRYNQSEVKKEFAMLEELEHDAKAVFKADLAEQVKRREKRKGKEESVRLAYQKQQNDAFKGFVDEDNEKLAKRHAKVEVLKKMREEQIRDLERRRNREAEKIRRREAKYAQRVLSEIQAEKDKEAKKKADTKKMMRQVLKENDARNKIKEEARKREEEEAIALQKQYIATLDAQEQAKKDALAATMKKQETKLAALLDSTAAEREANRLAEERAEKERLVKQAEKDAELKGRDDKRYNDMQECKRVIALQIREKEDRIRREIEEDREYGRLLKIDTDRAEAEEQAKIDRRKAVSLEQEKFLNEQVAAVEHRKLMAMAEMSNTEAAMNRDLLSRVKSGQSAVRKPKINPSAPFEWRYKRTSKPF